MTRSPKAQRRAILKATGAAAGVGLLGRLALAQDGTETTTETTETTETTGATDTTETTATTDQDIRRTIVLGGRTDAWLGLAPGVIERADNPTLGLLPGERHRVVWVNLDGRRHQFQILDERDGEDGTVLQETDPSSRTGATRSVTFRANDRMRRYRCRFHPDQMRGNIIQSGDFGTGTTGGTFTTGRRDTTDGFTTRTTDGFTTETTDGFFTDTTNGFFTTETTDGFFTDTTNGFFTTETTDRFFTDTTTRG